MIARPRPLQMGLACLTLLLVLGCSSDTTDTVLSNFTTPIVEVVASDFAFELPTEVEAGWVTFRMTNTGKQEHFMYVYRLPSNKTYDAFLQEAMVPFGRVWTSYAEGELDRAEAGEQFGKELPSWFMTEIVPSGGPALTEPGETAISTVKLEPGVHVVECYVKMPDGTWHTERGMQRELTVTPSSSNAPPPTADANVTLSSYDISSSPTLPAGIQTIAVRVLDRPDGFMAHDINLFRLSDDLDVQDLVAWMDWMDLSQFRAPAPGHSLGGMEHLAAGQTGYVTVNLTPGRYAWVSEGYASKGMLHEFRVE